MKAPSIDTRISYSEAHDLASVLQNIRGLEWKENISDGLVRDLGFCRIKVISPTKDDLERNLKEYERVEYEHGDDYRVRISLNRIIINQQQSLEN